MDRVGAGGPRRFEYTLAGEIRVAARSRPYAHRFLGLDDMGCARIGVGVDGDAREPHGAHAAQDAACDLAAVGDQNFAYRCRHGAGLLAGVEPPRQRRSPSSSSCTLRM
jgi:hypothetical protein